MNVYSVPFVNPDTTHDNAPDVTHDAPPGDADTRYSVTTAQFPDGSDQLTVTEPSPATTDGFTGASGTPADAKTRAYPGWG